MMVIIQSHFFYFGWSIQKDMAYLKSNFFELNLDVRAARRCVIHSQTGGSTIKIGLPKNGRRKFKYELWKSTKDVVKSDSIRENQLCQFVFMEQYNGILSNKVSTI
jgi:hypothetical protein